MSLVEKAAKYPHILQYDEATNTLDIFADHHVLSTLRACEAKFDVDVTRQLELKGSRYWSLEFGIWFHAVMENYYNNLKNNTFDLAEWVSYARNLWTLSDLDWFASAETNEYDNKRHKAIGGWPGAKALLLEYFVYYETMPQKVIATEVSFGRKKEVKISSSEYLPTPFNSVSSLIQTNFYLSGRIDLLLDDGRQIGPADHKTTAFFKGFEHQNFEVHEGITGYIYAVDQILRSGKFPSKYSQCGAGWIQHISIGQPSKGTRFKTTPIYRTTEELEAYRRRQVRTFKKLYELLVLEETPDFNTSICNNYFHSKCPHHNLHRQPERSWPIVIENSYQPKKAWNTEEM